MYRSRPLTALDKCNNTFTPATKHRFKYLGGIEMTISRRKLLTGAAAGAAAPGLGGPASLLHYCLLLVAKRFLRRARLAAVVIPASLVCRLLSSL